MRLQDSTRAYGGMSAVAAAAALDTPWYFPHRVDKRSVGFIYLPLRDAQAAWNLDLSVGLRNYDAPRCSVPLDDVVARASNMRMHAQTPSLIFHSAFCCSTLLARLLSVGRRCNAVKEPAVLDDLVYWRPRDDAWGRTVGAMLALLARRWFDDVPILVKASDACSWIGLELLTVQPEMRAMLVYSSLESFLVSSLRTTIRRVWCHERLHAIARHAPHLLPESQWDASRDEQVAAAVWLAQMRAYVRVTSQIGPERVRTLDGRRLPAEPTRVVDAVAAHCELGRTANGVDQCALASVLARHAKSGGPFRPSVYEAARVRFAKQVARGLEWAEPQAKVLQLPASHAL